MQSLCGVGSAFATGTGPLCPVGYKIESSLESKRDKNTQPVLSSGTKDKEGNLKVTPYSADEALMATFGKCKPGRSERYKNFVSQKKRAAVRSPLSDDCGPRVVYGEQWPLKQKNIKTSRPAVVVRTRRARIDRVRPHRAACIRIHGIEKGLDTVHTKQTLDPSLPQ
ncbi:unnamed protein product [Danaus chrysippus]|uniref:(African queen) hypothetical protein n=1 Tax=Danaus chrysippus TaxID=151541 RepID=A0A8J2QPM5_9NEOP|nr:unnamed protein product [Danaus chrysippus]